MFCVSLCVQVSAVLLEACSVGFPVAGVAVLWAGLCGCWKLERAVATEQPVQIHFLKKNFFLLLLLLLLFEK